MNAGFLHHPSYGFGTSVAAWPAGVQLHRAKIGVKRLIYINLLNCLKNDCCLPTWKNLVHFAIAKVLPYFDGFNFCADSRQGL